MIYFFHHYDMPLILHQQRLQRIINDLQTNGSPTDTRNVGGQRNNNNNNNNNNSNSEPPRESSTSRRLNLTQNSSSISESGTTGLSQAPAEGSGPSNPDVGSDPIQIAGENMASGLVSNVMDNVWTELNPDTSANTALDMSNDLTPEVTPDWCFLILSSFFE